eukprot:scaffold103_cov147-Skeletonema_menzelii.AAC.7
MDGLRNLSAIAADMPRLDCSSNATSHTHGLRYKAEPLETDTHEGSQALLRLSSQSRSSVTESEGEMSFHPSQPASVNLSAQKDSSMSFVAQLPSSSANLGMATAAIGGSFPHGLDPFSSSTLDEYYKSQAKIHQVYVNNAVAAATATSSMPTTPFPGGLGVSSVPATLAIIRGSPFDQYHPNTAEELSILQHYYGQQQPVNDHYLPYYCPATTSILMDQIKAKMAANYTAILGQRQQQEQQQQNKQFRQPVGPSHSTLFLPSDANFLSEAHCFIRYVCIELFTSTEHHLTAGGRGARPSHVGQVGFRCIHCKHQPRDLQANQAVSFPSSRDNIFESVRNFQRVHMECCQFIPPSIKLTYQEIIQNGNHTPKRSHKLVRAYYSQAASEMGLIDTPFGLRYRDECGYYQRAGPSLEMLNILEAAQAEEKDGTRFDDPINVNKSASLKKHDNKSSSLSSSGGKPVTPSVDVKYGKFDALSSKLTKQVILNARKGPSILVQPQDFPTISDFIFLLFHQLKPCKATIHKKRRRSLTSPPGSTFDREQHSSTIFSMPFAGLCCKHCQKDQNENVNGMYFPSNVECLGDSSFSQTFLLHLMNSCDHVPQDIKHALTELKNLAREYSASVKRGSKKIFVAKVWKRLESYAAMAGNE